MKVLSVGNSFSCDMQRYARQVAEASGADLTVVNAYRPGCTMLMHADYLKSGEKIYRRYVDGSKVSEKEGLIDILTSDVFDYVTLQSGTHDWNKYGTVPDNFPYIFELLDAVKRYQPQAETVYNHYWPDGERSVRDVFTVFFGGDRQKEIDWWQKFADRVKNETSVRFICPCGYAVNEAYPAFGSRIYEDEAHLSRIGSYLMGCLWTEFYTGYSPSRSFLPEGVEVTPDEAAFLREVAHKACLSCETPARVARK